MLLSTLARNGAGTGTTRHAACPVAGVMQDAVRRLVIGAAAGAAATLPMSAFMLAAQRAGFMTKLPPKRITEAALDELGLEDGTGETATNVLSSIAHFGFGAAAGALYAALDPRLRLPVPAPVQGALFGTGVWTVSYMGWVPALRIMPQAYLDEPGRPESMLVAHWIYGGVLGAIVRAATED